MDDGLAPTLLVAGTASHVGKTTVVAGLCRHLTACGQQTSSAGPSGSCSDDAIDVVPFKAQNMSNNARAVPKADAVGGVDADFDENGTFGEIGVSQYVQARAAGIRPTTDCNPVLLKPRGDAQSQLVVDGEAVAHYSAREYYEKHWNDAKAAAEAAWRRLAADHDLVIAEGAGSIAETNLHDRDLANLETARFADADVLLVADIERGGVFASLVGTLELLPGDVRDRVVGVTINKFRGDETLLEPGIEMFEERTDVPVLGVLPYDDPGLPEEDSLSLAAEGEQTIHGNEDGVPDDRSVTIAVPRLPRISNFTDLEPLAAVSGIRVSYRSLDASLDDADAVVLPGSKNSVDDLLALREAGLHRELRAFEGPIVGLCGGYQLLGERLLEADIEGTGDQNVVEGIGLLPIETTFTEDKRVTATTLYLDGTGPLSGAVGAIDGYEIHMGETRATGPVETPFSQKRGDSGDAAFGAACGPVLGTYLHGLFENHAPCRAFVERTFRASGRALPEGSASQRSPYERAGALVADNLDVGALLARVGIDPPKRA